MVPREDGIVKDDDAIAMRGGWGQGDLFGRLESIKQLNEPIEVKFTEWNTGGLLTRIEGLRAFLPKAELLSRVNNFTELKEKVS
ncbi:hypothetical protein CUMW_046620 [Citrus unshiu]|nr:hypothetical protein CUMW_046620 [Citrus unshiu]